MVAISVGGGWLYRYLFLRDDTVQFAYIPMVDGAIGGALFWGFMFFIWPSRQLSGLRQRLPFLGTLAVFLTVVFCTIVLTGIFNRLVLTGSFDLTDSFLPGWHLYIYVGIVSLVLLLVLQITNLVGPRVLWNVILGRYHRPREEKRIFLFVDLVGSTALAKELGDLGMQRLLSRFFFDIAEPIAENGGEIHAYVGDEVIITWQYQDGLKNGRCVTCFFDIMEKLATKSEKYRNIFGTEPKIRGGLHGGPVVTSECGDTKTAIVYFGDTVNTTARLEEAAKIFDKDLVVSAELLQKLHIPDQIQAETLGSHILRGHKVPTPLVSLALNN